MKRQTAQKLFEKWWPRNKWKGIQWYPLYLAEDAFKAGFRAGRAHTERVSKP